MSDQSTVRLVIATLAALALSVVVGGIYLAAVDRSLPGELIAIGSAAAGAVAGILSKTGSTQVEVVNPRNDPVNVAEAGHAAGDTLVTVAVIVIAVVAVLFAANLLPVR